MRYLLTPTITTLVEQVKQLARGIPVSGVLLYDLCLRQAAPTLRRIIRVLFMICNR